MTSIRYKTGTASAPFSQGEMDKFKRMMRIDAPAFEFEDAYVRFVSQQNGGEPIERFFRAADGNWYPIDRFLNFADTTKSSPQDVLFNVHQNWNDIEDRLAPGMFPLAVLPGGDYLLGDHSCPPKAPIALWLHEKSTEGNPSVMFVAAEFEEFLSILRPNPG